MDSYSPVLASMDSLMYRLSPCIVLLFLKLLVEAAYGASQAEVNRNLEMGGMFLAQGQLSDALTYFHQAVEGDPSNYLTYFKRGTVYLALTKAKNALSDFDKVLELKPDFVLARLKRGNIHLKQASYDLAHLDYYNVLQADPYNGEALENDQAIDPTRTNLDNAKWYISQSDYDAAIQLLSRVIEVSPWDPDLRELRAECYLSRGDSLAAIADIRTASKMGTDSTDGYFRLAKLLYDNGFASEALKEIRECLRLDPEHRDCFPYYKRIKKVEKALADAEIALEEKRFHEAVEAAERVLKFEKDTQMIIFKAKRMLCTGYVNDEQTSQAIKACDEALEMFSDVDILCDRAEAYIQSEMFDDAIRDYRSALEIDESFHRAKEGLQKAQKLQHQSERRDYYKILNVKRTATKKEIVKAYRKAAQQWHPDNFQGDEKKKAEKKFIDIAAAKEVLTDEEKRRQFDSGEDPLDPEQQGGRQGGAHQFFHQYQYGSPFQFKFHFN